MPDVTIGKERRARRDAELTRGRPCWGGDVGEPAEQLVQGGIYQHATRDRDQAIAKALGTFVRDRQSAGGKRADDPEQDVKKA